MRFDVLLHELRLFKSRSQARAAIDEGQALLGGKAVKPSHEAKPGDRITLVGPGGARTLEVLEIPRGSVSKKDAKQFVRDTAGGT